MRRLICVFGLIALLSGCTVKPLPTSVTPTAEQPPSPTQPAQRVPLRVFCAGSLMIPFAALEEGFEAANPDIDMQMEAHGSIQVIRRVTDIHERIDVVASADYALVPMLMYHTQDPDTGQPYGTWAIRFASNRIVLAYAPTSRGADQLNADNWAEVITQPGTRVGLADPRFDACGYRQLMVLQLAEGLYGRKTLFEDVFAGRFGQPIRAVVEEGHTLIRVPEVLEPRVNATIVLRGSSVQLIPLLQSGDVDYIFEYESMVRQHRLQYIELAPELNLGDAAHAANYCTVTIKLDMQRFASVEPLFTGDLIAYGLTIPSNAEHPAEAARFAAYLLGEEGRRTMAEHHHPLLDPPLADHHDRLPEVIKPLCAQE
ncbi:MAG: tungstate ABC transporter substrate-binding protein WtpA [Chloroflexi bacterium]|jgi:molybdate/tungstate transport system substrate-binding protein|nr:tungstate ABC transporter substrate-binding protein WtpA [Chloroflexota bacterium]